MIKIAPADPKAAETRVIIAAHIAHGEAHYPAESNHHLDVDDYAERDVELLGAWVDGKLTGIIGLARLDDQHGELKSMHVLESARGHGLGGHLVQALIDRAKAMGLRDLSLETGSREASAAARALYLRHGFDYCPPFGSYLEDPESVFMTRRL